MVAGGLTKSYVLGFVGGIELPPIKAAYEGWVNGARAVNPKVQSREVHLNSFDDAAVDCEAALALIWVGADLSTATPTRQPSACSRRSRNRPGYMSSGRTPSEGLAPDRAVGSAVIDLPRAFRRWPKHEGRNRPS